MTVVSCPSCLNVITFIFPLTTAWHRPVVVFFRHTMVIQICISCQWSTYLFTIDLVSLEISGWSLKKPPVSAFVVCDISFYLVLFNFIWQENPFNPGNLQTWEMESGGGKKKKREGEKETLNYSDLSKAAGLVQRGKDVCMW